MANEFTDDDRNRLAGATAATDNVLTRVRGAGPFIFWIPGGSGNDAYLAINDRPYHLSPGEHAGASQLWPTLPGVMRPDFLGVFDDKPVGFNAEGFAYDVDPASP